jgi:membrane fusion protein (multidrug efflux system)
MSLKEIMKKRTFKRIYNAVIIVLLIAAGIYALSRFVHPGHVEWTDDAQVHRHITPINTRIQGFIKEIRFDDYQYVHRGDTLVIIEDAEYRLQLAQAEANVKGSRQGGAAVKAGITTTQSNVKAASAGVSAATAAINEARVNMQNAQRDYERYAALLKKGAVTQQQYDAMHTRYEEARARYEGAQARRNQAAASRQSTALTRQEQTHRLGQSTAGTSVAEAALHLAQLNLSYTIITATADGYMGRKDIHVGQLVQPGQLLARIIDSSSLWVIANYRETQMKHIAVGQKVTFTADAIPDVEFNGRVQALSFGTGSAYTDVPVDNATGNFVKVEQRVPVRIELTSDNDPKDVRRLLAGLNVEASVHW